MQRIMLTVTCKIWWRTKRSDNKKEYIKKYIEINLIDFIEV